MLVSVVILNYQGKDWIQRCVESVLAQTIRHEIEVIVLDNGSTDGSLEWVSGFLENQANARVIPFHQNLGYCAANNRAAEVARGEYLFFLNNDAWLEEPCLERLVETARARRVQALCPRVLDYGDDHFQSMGAMGMDLFGFPSSRIEAEETCEVLMPEGCGYLVERRVFLELGGFDELFFMYADEYDFSIRLWIAGYRAVTVPKARMHHRGAAQVNPAGGAHSAEFRTSDLKRYYSNRNALLVLLKNGQDLLLAMVVLQVLLLGMEAVVSLFLIRRWSHVKRAFLDAFMDCWRFRSIWYRKREEMAGKRVRSDLDMMRFLKCRLNRWDELIRIRRQGLPKITASR